MVTRRKVFVQIVAEQGKSGQWQSHGEADLTQKAKRKKKIFVHLRYKIPSFSSLYNLAFCRKIGQVIYGLIILSFSGKLRIWQGQIDTIHTDYESYEWQMTNLEFSGYRLLFVIRDPHN